MTRRLPSCIAVVGTITWVEVAANLLRRAGLDARALRVPRLWVPLRMPFSRLVLSADVVHMVWGGHLTASLVGAYLLRKKLVWHWVGSDVLAYARRKGLIQRLRKHLAERIVRAHLADSPELAEELQALGIAATVCRLLPPSVQADPLPLPDTFRVLSYWVDERREFYGGDTILQLARAMPDVEFLIAGAAGRGAPLVPNVRYLGRVADLDPIYAQTSVFLRLPQHDSLSAMVLEALARGRYVIYNKPFPACHRADTFAEARAALEDIRQRIQSNLEGSRLVREQFSLLHEAETAARVYAQLF